MVQLEIIETRKIDVPNKSFWDAVFNWIYNPHFISNQIIGSKLLFKGKLILATYLDTEITKYLEELIQINLIDIDKINEQFLIDYFQNGIVQNVENIIVEKTDENSLEDGCIIYVFLLLPKSLTTPQQLFICLEDRFRNHIYHKWMDSKWLDSQTPLFPPYVCGFKYNNPDIILWTEHKYKAKGDKLFKKIFGKVSKWAIESESMQTRLLIKSLSLIPVDKYAALYQELKQKYASKIIDIWPENTDPEKFVHEDVAIATYLILFWKQEQIDLKLEKKQTFVDLGCGNGLLVYLLTQEGYSGKGIDIRSRKIWSFYPSSVVLEVRSLTPSNKNVFPEYDWLIGNHSDELTPWIPVMAARSSRKCRYFLLPCCPYEFNGEKYQRSNSGKSQYSDYLDYVQQISEICGFFTLKDKLRIPSTKRICLIGTKKDLQAEDNDRNHIIQQFIDARCQNCGDSEGNWVSAYKLRPSVEPVRNCTQIDKAIINGIVKRIAGELLTQLNYVEDEFGKQWNRGGKLNISEAVKIFEQSELKKLKNECGGLQTLLRNHRYIFDTREGVVQLQMPRKNSDDNKNAKKTQCWFQLHHPDGCPLSEQNCRYKHV